jgi:hypothetical protein
MRSRSHASLLRLALLGPSIISAALVVASCGKSATNSSDGAMGHPDGAQAGSSIGGSSMAMAGGGVARTSGGRTGDAGSSTGGSASNGGGGAQGSAGSSATAGAGGLPLGEAGAGSTEPLLGVGCRNSHCVPGEVCVICSMPEGAEWRCVPHPVTAPEAYETATASCEPVPFNYSECDGPEDCPSDQYCVAAEGADGRQRCRSAPAVRPFCCFTCNALVNCTLCRNDGDCPEGEACGIVYESLKGCTRK